MLRQLLNECMIDLTLIPDGPVLIKSGLPTLSGPDMAFVTTWRGGQQEVYLPGSSLKGVLRSHAERIARTLNPHAACNPFAKLDSQQGDAFCGNIFEERKKEKAWSDYEKEGRVNQVVYHDSCPICRLFGSTWFAGRLATEDAYAPLGQAPRPQQRDGVGIDRFSGGAAQGVKFDLEVITSGEFATHLHLRNFELWQLGLVGFVLTDLADGLVRIGAAKSRGLGRVRGVVQNVRLDFLGPQAPQPENNSLTLKGVGALADETTAKAYGLERPDQVDAPFTGAPAANGLRTTYRFAGPDFPWAALGASWVKKASAYQPANEMKNYRKGRTQ